MLDAPSATALLERSAHLAFLDDWLQRVVETREGRLVLLRGEAGAGKTAVAQRFCEQRRPPARALWGSCEALFAPRALGPFADIAVSTGGELEALVERGARAHEVLDALADAVAKRPTVVVLEDLHWADEATLDVLRLLGRRIAGVRALVVATYRDDELGAGHPLRRVVGELARTPGTATLDVAPLSPAAVAELAEPCGVDPAALHRRTGGNAFFVTEVLVGGGAEIPGTVRDAVLARVAGLEARDRALLEAITVPRPGAELGFLEAIAGDAILSLGECLGSGVVVPSGHGVAFRHELERQVIDEALAPHRRAALHARALAALTAADRPSPDLARLAHHAEAAGDVDAVLRYAPRAAERASTAGAHRESAAQYARALRFADRLTAEQRADLLERQSYECMVTDQLDDAIGALDEAVAIRRALGDVPGEGRALAQMANVLWCPGRVEQARAAARQAVVLLERTAPDRELALAHGRMAQLCLEAGELDRAVEWGARAVQLAESLGAIDIVVSALCTTGTARLVTGDDEGAELLERSVALARDARLDADVARAMTHRATLAVRGRDYALACERLEQAIGYASRHGVELFLGYLLGYRAEVELHLGRWQDAAATAAIVLSEPRRSRIPRIQALTVLARVRARRGDPGVAPLLEEALALSERGHELQADAPVAVARAEACWLASDRDGVARATSGALELARRLGSRRITVELLAWRRRAGIADDPVDAGRDPHSLELSGEWAAAAARWRALGCPYDAALALAAADDESALRQSLDELRSLGARPAEAIVARRLRERGVRGVPRGPRARTRENPAGLTGRELEVLTLLAEGMSDAQIAERLVVSRKTVHHHVSAVLRKLDVSSRGRATAQALRTGLLDDVGSRPEA